MENEVLKYFMNVQGPDYPKSLARRIGLELCRGNISTMSQLCRLCENEPEKLKTLRNIGEKNLTLILEVCADYQKKLEGKKQL